MFIVLTYICNLRLLKGFPHKDSSNNRTNYRWLATKISQIVKTIVTILLQLLLLFRLPNYRYTARTIAPKQPCNQSTLKLPIVLHYIHSIYTYCPLDSRFAIPNANCLRLVAGVKSQFDTLRPYRRFSHMLSDRFNDWLIDQLIEWLTGWLIDWSAARRVDGICIIQLMHATWHRQTRNRPTPPTPLARFADLQRSYSIVIYI